VWSSFIIYAVFPHKYPEGSPPLSATPRRSTRSWTQFLLLFTLLLSQASRWILRERPARDLSSETKMVPNPASSSRIRHLIYHEFQTNGSVISDSSDNGPGKTAVANHHIKTLQAFKDADSAPRSFLRIIQPAVPKITTTFSLQWHRIHHHFATQLNEALLSYWMVLLEEAEKETAELTTTLQEQCTEEIFQHILRTIKMQLTRTRVEESRKRRRIADSQESINQRNQTQEQ
jgi:hypothetical protein